MPVSDTGMRSPTNNSDMSTGTRPKSPQETRSKLQRQISMNKYDQEYKRNQFSKQESKDSGIVTEMALRPKDLDLTRSESMKSRNKVEKSPSMRGRSHNSSTKSKSGSMKYKQRSKTTSDLVPMKYNEENEIELLTPKQNGTVENTDQDKQYSSASIKGMWKKAFKSLKSSPSDSKLSKKASLKKKQGSKEEEEEEEQGPREIDPVYSLLKCAADLPKNSRIPCTVHAHCGGHHPDSSSSTSKTSSPSSSVSQSPKTRRKKLNARMKSFSLDAPEPSKHLLAIDETTKKKSSSFTNTCLRGSRSPDDKYALSATNLRKKFASSAKASSLDIESGGMSPSPKESPKPNRKNKQDKDKDNLYVVLYHFKGKEKDDMDLRAGSKVRVTDSSDPDWWKGKCNGRSGYFPAKYVITIQKNQKVYQVNHPMHLTDGDVDMKLHKDQIVLQIGEEDHGMIFVKAANKKQAMCPLKYLKEV